MEKRAGFLDRLFHLTEHGTDIKTEIIAGITTFMTMAYILIVNPSILSAAGMDKGAVLTATALAGFIGTILMAGFANYPFALAPGMGLNAFFCVYGLQTDGLLLGNGSCCGIRRRYYLHIAFSYKYS